MNFYTKMVYKCNKSMYQRTMSYYQRKISEKPVMSRENGHQRAVIQRNLRRKCSEMSAKPVKSTNNSLVQHMSTMTCYEVYEQPWILSENDVFPAKPSHRPQGLQLAGRIYLDRLWTQWPSETVSETVGCKSAFQWGR